MRIFKRRKIQFTDKTQPISGIISCIIGIVSVVIMFGLFIGAGRAKGNAGFAYGILGIINMFGSLVGFVLGVRCYRIEDIYYRYPNLGTGLNAIVTLLYMVLYGIGIS